MMEKVLCIKRTDMPDKWLMEQSAIKMKEEVFFSFISATDFRTNSFKYHWIDRPIAENDKAFKQIIPYIIIQADNGNLTAIYRRKGSENRLHGLWSIGIGGHINPLDSHIDNQSYYNTLNKFDNIVKSDGLEIPHSNTSFGYKIDFKTILYSGMKREFYEEIIISPQTEFIKGFIFAPQFLGVINDDLSEVGKVHFGVVFRVLADSPDYFTAGEELLDFQWVKTEKLSAKNLVDFNLELWSQLAVQIF
ncbi:MAG: phosphoesterase [Desulfamplus sp.]|nr:phosphoesterase [Desulfamplus sp.]